MHPLFRSFAPVLLALMLPVPGILSAQPSTRAQIDALKAKLKDYSERTTEETAAFDRFLKEKKLLLEQKTKEKASVDDEVGRLEIKNGTSRARARELQFGLDRIAADEKALLERIRGRAEDLTNRIAKGIPFERDRRAGVMQGLVSDIKAGGLGAMEGLNRMVAFLDAEDLLSYDSQVVQSIEQVDAERLNVQLLRVGRVFFAVDSGPEVYVYRKIDNNPWTLDTKSPLSMGQKRDIRQAVLIIQGKQAPELVPLPIAASLFAHVTNAPAGGAK